MRFLRAFMCGVWHACWALLFLPLIPAAILADRGGDMRLGDWIERMISPRS